MIENKTKPNYALMALMSFAVMAIAILPILIMNDGKFFLAGDYMTQQIPFMKECRRVILSGTPFWSSNTFLGANFVGTYSFYVYGSPFFWPLLFIPESYMSYALGVLFVLKHVVSALTSYLYLSKHIDNNNFAVIGALMYAFSGFSIDSSFYYHFLDVIAFFPLVLYFADCVLENKNKILLSLTALLCAVVNYYFFVSTSFIFLFYLLFRVKYSSGKYTVKDAFRCIFSYGLGCLAAAIVLVPSALSLLETSEATDGFLSKLLTVLAVFPSYIKFIEAIILPSEGILHSGVGFTYLTFNSIAAFLPFFGGFFYIIALRRKEKFWDARLLKFFTVLTIIPFGNGVFSLFTNMVYTRWWYGFVLIMILVSLKTLQGMQNNPYADAECKKSAKIIVILASVVTFVPLVVKLIGAYAVGGLLLDFFPENIAKSIEGSGITKPLTITDLRYFIVLLFLTALSYLPLFVFYKKKWIFTKKVVPIVMIICMLTYGTYLTSEHITANQRSRSIFYEQNEIPRNADTVYTARVQNKKSLANFSMISNEPGVSTFHSFKSHATTEFARIAGYGITSAPTTPACFTTKAIQTVLSIETVVNKDSSRTPAEYYTPMGYSYDYYIEDDVDYTSDKKVNNKRIEMMTQACYLDKKTADALKGIVEPIGDRVIEWEKACDDRKLTASSDFVMDTKGFRCITKGDKERLIYFSVPNDNGWTAYVNNQKTPIYTVNGGMMGIVVPRGESNIEFKFFPPGLDVGTYISVLSLTTILIYAFVDFKLKNKKRYL